MDGFSGRRRHTTAAFLAHSTFESGISLDFPCFDFGEFGWVDFSGHRFIQQKKRRNPILQGSSGKSSLFHVKSGLFRQIRQIQTQGLGFLDEIENGFHRQGSETGEG